MCGICGIVSSNNLPEGIYKLRKMGARLLHRGPDSWGEWSRDKKIFLGMTRLAIIDVKHGSQPMYSKDGDLVVVFNGEIYNYKKLWKILADKGYRFNSEHSDTEVIVNGYLEWGEKLFSKLNGMFGLAIWQNSKKQLLLARDRMGIKPLYYRVNNGSVAFASEPKSLLVRGITDFSLNKEKLPYYYLLRSPGRGETLFKNIFSLDPGSVAIFRNNKIIKRFTYWEPVHVKGFELKNNNTAEDTLMGLLQDSIRSEMVTDVPLGSFLSGGVDSSLIAVIANSFNKVDTYTLGTHSKLDESKYAKMVANRSNFKNKSMFATPDQFINNFSEWMYYNDDPVSDPSALGLMLLSDFAREGNMKVMLSGEGGDELFGGYNSYLRFSFTKKFTMIMNFLNLFNFDFIDRFDFRLNDYAKNKSRFFWGTAHITNQKMRNGLFLNSNNDLENYFLKIFNKFEGFQPLRKAMLFDQVIRLPQEVLGRTDRATMGRSLEARVPLLNYKLVEFANCLDDNLCIKGFNPKYILKRVAEKIIPKETIYRKKMGFDLPVGEWIKTHFKDRILHYVDDKKMEGINYSYFQNIINKNNLFNEDVATMWAFITLESWYRKWNDSNTEIYLNKYVKKGNSIKILRDYI